MKQYELNLPQADIEFLDGALESYATNQSHIVQDVVMSLRLKLNSVLSCEYLDCRGKRDGLSVHCVDHAEARAAA